MNTEIAVCAADTGKWINAPSLRPIQFRWMSLIDSGQSRTFRSSSSRSAYAVMRIFHCFKGRLNTGKLPRSLRPSDVTSSFASTVPNPGHQFTGASSRYASRNESTVRRRSTSSSFDQSPPPGTAPCPRFELVDELRDRTGAIDRRVVPGVEDLQEDPLRPPIERDVGGGHRAAGIVPEPEAVQLAPVVGDVRLGRDAGVLAGLHGVLLRGQTERVVAHGVQHVVAGHAQVARVDVGTDEAERVPNMQPVAARIGKHVEHEHLRPLGHLVETGRQRPRGIGGAVCALVVPPPLPARLDLLRERPVVPMRRDVIVPGRGHRCGRSVARGHEVRGYWPTLGEPGSDS